MSLKAKLEAVIYAAEEPVTLAQLAVLFADEAFAWKEEQEALQAELARTLESDATPVEPEPVTEGSAHELGIADSTVELSELVVVAEEVAEARQGEPEASAEVEEEPAAQTEAEPESSTDSASQPQAAPESAAEPSEAEIDPEAEARRLERKRDREAREILRGILNELIADYGSEGRGLEIREIAGGYRMATKPEIHDAVRSFVKSLKPPMKLSLPALETLAVIAYKQPVTAPEVGEIRGVDSAGVLGSLISRKLIATAGRKQVIGRPMLYKTTKEFLLRFGLKDLNELPSMEEFEKMAQMELSEVVEEAEETAEAPLVNSDPAEEEADEEESVIAESAVSEMEEAPQAEQSLPAEEEMPKSEEPNAASEASIEDSPAVPEEAPTPAAEHSQEPSEAHAPVERQDAEEIEVQK